MELARTASVLLFELNITYQVNPLPGVETNGLLVNKVPGYQVTSSHTLAHTYSMPSPIAHIFLPHTLTHALTHTLMGLPIATKYGT